MSPITFVLIATSALVALSSAQSCGQSNVPMRPNRQFDPDGQRIVGGVEARPNSHPWIVSLALNGRHSCGGTLLRVGNQEQTDIVLTAAHCFVELYQFGWNEASIVAALTISAGAHDLTRPTSTQQTVRAKSYVVHAQYDNSNKAHDIAIIKLATPIKFTSAVQPGCLPTSGEQVGDSVEGTVAGWGDTYENSQRGSNILLQVGVPTIASRNCISQYSRAGIAINPSIMFCAGFPQGGKDSCQGDSGGPFVFKQGNSYVVQGVVSFGIGCAQPGFPGVYTRVGNFIPWINTQVRTLSSFSG